MNTRYEDPPRGGDDTRGADPEVDVRLLDYVYDELEPAERARLEGELAADPRLANEVAALRQTRMAFAGFERERMPPGLLDDVLAQADQQAKAFAAEEQPGWWARITEGFKRLAFQPAFAMGFMLLLVAGVALVATRDPEKLPGMAEPRDIQRLPPVAMAPAPVEPRLEEAAAKPVVEAGLADGLLAQGAAERDQAEPPAAAAPAPIQAVAASAAEPAIDSRRSGEKMVAMAEDLKPALGSADSPKVDAMLDAPTFEASAKGDFDDLAKAKGAVASGAAARDEAPPRPTAAPAGGRAKEVAPTPAEDPNRFAATENKKAEIAYRTPPTEPAPSPVLADKAASKDGNAAERPAPPAREASGNREEAEQAGPERVTRTVETASAPRRESQDARIDDEARVLPSTPALARPAKPADSAPDEGRSPERLYTTLSQQLAAGAVADAEKTLQELAKAEGESARVKKAREALAKAKEASRARTGNTSGDKPLPEPTRTPTP